MYRRDSFTLELLKEGLHLNSSDEQEASHPHTVLCASLIFLC